MTTEALDAAWAAVHDATPAGWHVLPPRYRPEAPGAPWVVVASNPHARAEARRSVQASGATEIAALRYLADRLRRETPTTGGVVGRPEAPAIVP